VTLFVVISPDSGSFKTKLIAQLKKALTGVEGSVPVSPDIFSRAEAEARIKAALAGLHPSVPVGLDADAAAFRAKLQAALAALHPDVPVGINVEGAAAAAAKVKAEMAAAHADIPVGADLDPGSIAAAIMAIRTLMRNQGLADFLDIDMGSGRMVSQIQLLKRRLAQAGVSDILEANLNQTQIDQQLARLAGEKIPLNFDVGKMPEELKPGGAEDINVTATTSQAQDAVAALLARLEVLSQKLTDLRIGADDTAAEAVIAALQVKLAALTEATKNIIIGVDTTRLDAAIAAEQAKITAWTQKMRDLQVNADTAAATAKIAALEKQLAGLYAELKEIEKAGVDLDINAALTHIYAVEAQLYLLKSDARVIKLNAQTAVFNAQIAASMAKITALKAQARDIVLGGGVDTAGLAAAEAKFLALDAATQKLSTALSGVTAIEAELAATDTLLAGGTGVLSDSFRKLAAAQGLGALAAKALNTSLEGAAAVEAELAAADVLLGGQSARLSASFGDIAKAQGLVATTLAAVDAELKEKPGDLAAVTLGADAVGVAFVTMEGGLAGAARGWGGLLTKLNLFGGLLPGIMGHVQVWHVLLDFFIEFLAVAVPGTIGILALAGALGIFVLVGQQAGDTFSRIYDRGMAVFQMTQALGTSLYPMRSAFSNLETVMRPEIFELLGEAINGTGTQTANFGRIAVATGRYLDQLGAKIAVWVSSSNFTHFLGIAVADLVQFLRFLSNLGNALANFFRAAEITHIAEDFEELFVIISKGILAVSKLPSWLLAAALALHGVWLWGGLTTTILMKLLDPIRSAALALAGLDAASSNLGSLSVNATPFQKLRAVFADIGASVTSLPVKLGVTEDALQKVAEATGESVAGLTAFQAAADRAGVSIADLVTGPAAADVTRFGAGLDKAGVDSLNLAAAAGASQAGLGRLAAGLGSTSEEALRAGAGMAGIEGPLTEVAAGAAGAAGSASLLGRMMGSLGGLLASPVTWIIALGAALAVFTVEVIRAQDSTQTWIISMNQALAKTSVYQVIGQTVSDLAAVTRQLGMAQQGAAGNTTELSAAQTDLSGKLGEELTHVQSVAQAYGTNFVGALALLNAAQVTAGQLSSSNSKTWEEAKIQVAGLVSGYKAMAVGIGETENAVNAALVTGAGSGLVAMQKLDTAWDNFTALVSAPLTGFLTLDQSITTFGQDAVSAGASMTGLAGTIVAQSKKVGSTSVQLQQDFQSTYGDVEQLFDAYRNAQSVSGGGNFIAFTQDAVAALLPLARGNQAATAEISALAQEAGGPATTSLTALATWAGNVSDPLTALYKASQQATIGVSNLNQDAQQLATTLEGDIDPAMASAVFNAKGGGAAFATLAGDVAKLPLTSGKVVMAAKAVATELLSIDKNSTSAEAQFVGFMESMGLTAAQARKMWLAVTTVPVSLKKQLQAAGAAVGKLGQEVDRATGDKKIVLNVDLKDALAKFHSLSAGVDSTAKASGKLRDGLAQAATGGDDLARSGFWGQVRDKILGLAGDVKAHPITFAIAGEFNFIPGVTAALDKAGKVITGFFGKTVPAVWDTTYQGFQRDFAGPLASWFTTSLPHALGAAWSAAWSALVDPVEHAFDDVKKAIETGFDGWWKTHGEEIKDVGKALWAALSNIFGGGADLLVGDAKIMWGGIEQLFHSGAGNVTGITKAFWSLVTGLAREAWALIGPVVRAGWDILAGIFKVGISVVETVFKVFWDVLAAVAKAFWAAIVASVKIAWDTIVLIFSVALDLLTGHWSQAWDDIRAYGEQVWNALKQYYDTELHILENLFDQVLGDIKSGWDSSWGAIKTAAEQVWNDIKSGAASLVSSVKGTWDTLESVFSAPVAFLVNDVYDDGIRKLWNAVMGAIGGPQLPSVSFGGGGGGGGGTGSAGTPKAASSGPTVHAQKGMRIPGYGGGDIVPAWIAGQGPALLEPGEAVVSKETTRKYAPVLAAMGVPGFSSGGVVGDVLGFLSGAAHDVMSVLGKAVDVGKIVAALATGNTAALGNALNSLTGGAGGAKAELAEMIVGIPKAVIKQLVSKAAGIAETTAKDLAAAGAGAGTGGGTATPGVETVARYIMAHGGTKAAGAGVGGVVSGESSGDPEIYEFPDNPSSGGAGILQWTPPSCLSLSVQILTRRGWLTHAEVQPGDETIGYRPETGRSEWTRITAVHRYEDAEVWRIGNSRWHADVTPNHRWWSDTVPTCQPKYRHNQGEFVRTDELHGGHRIRLAAPADTDGIPGLSSEDVQTIAWLQGDGHIRPGNRTGYEVTTYRGTICQAKPAMVIKLRALLACVEHRETVRPGKKPHHFPVHKFALRNPYVTDLMKRSQVLETGPEAFVLALSPDQRASWLSAMIDAGGCREPLKKPEHHPRTRIAQDDGPLQDAIALAVYLEGWKPTYTRTLRAKPQHSPGGVISMVRPHVVPSRFRPHKILERQPVWCPTTDLGTWTARQDDQVFLTGNSASPIEPIITGNAGRDMANQLVDMMAYIGGRGGIGAINAGGKSGGPMGAARVFSAMEAPAVAGSDIDSGVVTSLFKMGLARGGRIPGFATGAIIPPGKAMAAAQAKELADYSAADAAVASSLANVTAGSWLAAGTHKARVQKELGELVKGQGYETSSYGSLETGGLTASSLSWFRSQAQEIQQTAQDADLGHVQAARMATLASELGALISFGASVSAAEAGGSSSSGSGSSGSGSGSGSSSTAGAAADLKAWRAKKGSKTINSQIAKLTGELPNITTLAGAKLSAALHAKYADAEASDKKQLSALGTELTVLRNYRTQLSGSDSSLSSWISAAGDTKILARNVAEWKKQLASQQKTVNEISAMLGPPAAQIALAAGTAATSKTGAVYLKAWEAKKSTPVNTQITQMTAQLAKDTTLAGAGGLSKALRAKYVKAEADDKRSLAALNTELSVMRDWRATLSSSDASLSSWISAAGSDPSLAKNVTAWKAQLAAQQKTVNEISAMLGPTAAELAAAATAAASASSSAAGSTASSAAGSSSSSAAGSAASSAPGVTISPEQALQLLNLASSVGGAPSGLMPSSGLPAPVPGAAAWFDTGGIIREPILGRGMRTGRSYGFGGRGPETVTPGIAGTSRASLDDVTGLLRELITATKQAPAAAGTNFGRALNGTARTAGMSGQYTTRKMPL
jgi:Phage tail lysozyme